jgi:hypothetical protein
MPKGPPVTVDLGYPGTGGAMLPRVGYFAAEKA